MNKETKFHFFDFSLGVLFSLQVLSFVFYFTGVSFALPEGIEVTISSPGGLPCGSSGLSVVDTITRAGGVPVENTCVDAGISFGDAILAQSKYTGGSCVYGYGPAFAPCTVMLITVCCDSNWAIALAKKTDGTVASGTIINVPIGNEKTVAENLYSTFDSEIAYPDYSSQSLVRTDGIKGFMYQVSMGTDESTSTVAVEAWKVGGYAPVGQVTPVEGIGSGSGGSGGLSKADTQAAVGDALTGVGLTGALIRQGMDDAWDRAHSLGYAGYVTGGGSGVGLTQSETQAAFKGALDDKFPAGDLNEYGSGYVGSGDPYSSGYNNAVFNDTTAPSLADSWTSFKSGVADAPILGLAAGFFSGVPTSASPELIEFDAGRYGQHSYSFSSLGSALSVLHAVVLVIFSFVAVKVVILKGGGG